MQIRKYWIEMWCVNGHKYSDVVANKVEAKIVIDHRQVQHSTIPCIKQLFIAVH